jgi:hypothetical protein
MLSDDDIEYEELEIVSLGDDEDEYDIIDIGEEVDRDIECDDILLGEEKESKSLSKNKGIDVHVRRKLRDLGLRVSTVRKDSKFDPYEATLLKRAGLTYSRIAEIYSSLSGSNVSKQSIYQGVDRTIDGNKDILDFSYGVAQQNEILTTLVNEKKLMAIRAIDADKLEKSTARDLATTAKTLNDIERLEGNKSTSNVAINLNALIRDSADKFYKPEDR